MRQLGVYENNVTNTFDTSEGIIPATWEIGAKNKSNCKLSETLKFLPGGKEES